MLYVLLILLFFLAVSFIMGSSLKRIRFFNKYIDDSLNNIILMPFIGVALIISFLQTTGLFVGTNSSSIFLLLACLILLVSSFYLKENVLVESLAIQKTAIFFCFIGSMIILFPILREGFPTSYSILNHDLIFYLSIPEWLLNNSYFDPANIDFKYNPYYYIADLHFSRFSRVGLDYFNAFGLSVLNLEPIQTFNIIGSFTTVLYILSVYYVGKYCFGFKNKLTIIFTGLLSINSFILYLISLQYVPQIAGNAFYFLAVGLIYKTISERNYKSILITAISISGLVSIYSEYLLYLLLPFSLYVFIEMVTKRNYLELIKISLSIWILSIILNPVAFYLAFKYNVFAFTSTKNASGIVEYLPFYNQILMVFGVKPLNYDIPQLVFIVISLLLLAIMIYGLVVLPKDIRNLMYSFVLFILAILIYLAFFNKFSYGYFKSLIFGQSIFILIFSIGVHNIIKNRLKILGILTLLILCLSNVYQMYKLENNIINMDECTISPCYGTFVDESYYELNNIKDIIPKEELLLLYGFDVHEQHVLSYFFKDRKIAFDNPSHYFGFLKEEKFEEERYLLIKRHLGSDIIPLGELIWSNEKYKLYKKGNFDIKLESGWHGIEVWDKTPTRWMDRTSSLIIPKNNNNQKIKLSFNVSLPPGVDKRTLLVLSNEEIIDEIEINLGGTYITNNINLLDNIENEIFFEVKEGTVNIGEDPRNLGIAIQNIFIVRD
jgi:hypothetical protein